MRCFRILKVGMAVCLGATAAVANPPEKGPAIDLPPQSPVSHLGVAQSALQDVRPLDPPQPPERQGQGRITGGVSCMGPTISLGFFSNRSDERVVQEVALDAASLLLISNIQLTYGHLFHVTPKLSIGPYLGVAGVSFGLDDCPNNSWPGRRDLGLYLVPAGGVRLVRWSQSATKRQPSGLFGMRVGFPVILQVEGGYAF